MSGGDKLAVASTVKPGPTGDFVDVPGTTRWGALGAAVVAATAGMLPVFAAATHGDPLRARLHVSAAVFGVILTCFFATTAIMSPLAGRAASRNPPAVLLLCASTIATLALTMIAFNRSALLLALTLVCAGAGNALVQPACARLVARDVNPRQIGAATGLLSAALTAAPLVPGALLALLAPAHGITASLLATAAVSLAGIPFARWARVLPDGEPAAGSNDVSVGVVPAALVLSVAPRERSSLALWSVGAGFATVGSTVAATYFVTIGHHSGLSHAAAGGLLSAAAGLAIGMRIAIGLFGDRSPRRNVLAVTVMMAVGAAALVLMASGAPGAFVAGALLIVFGGWGWTGLMIAVAIRSAPEAPHYAGASIQLGQFTGAAAAPLLFGVLTDVAGIRSALLVAASCNVVGAVTVRVGGRVNRRLAS